MYGGFLIRASTLTLEEFAQKILGKQHLMGCH